MRALVGALVKRYYRWLRNSRGFRTGLLVGGFFRRFEFARLKISVGIRVGNLQLAFWS
jgi:hypothetical protein